MREMYDSDAHKSSMSAFFQKQKKENDWKLYGVSSIVRRVVGIVIPTRNYVVKDHIRKEEKKRKMRDMKI